MSKSNRYHLKTSLSYLLKIKSWAYKMLWDKLQAQGEFISDPVESMTLITVDHTSRCIVHTASTFRSY